MKFAMSTEKGWVPDYLPLRGDEVKWLVKAHADKESDDPGMQLITIIAHQYVV